MLIGFKAIERGASHIEKGAPCQDSAYFFCDKSKTTGIIAVADGHGGEKYMRSERGSEFACVSAKQALWKFSQTGRGKADDNKIEEDDAQPKNSIELTDAFFKKNLPVCEDEIIRLWNLYAKDDFNDNPLSEKELAACKRLKIDPDNNESDRRALYGSTLLAALVTDDYWFVLQIGDGVCVVIDEEGRAYTPEELKPDDNEGFGVTHSICSSRAAQHFKHAFGFNRILGITVASDGIADSFIPEKYLEFMLSLRDDFIKDSAKSAKELQELMPGISKDGSRDDVSIAGLWRRGSNPNAVRERTLEDKENA